MTDETDDFDDAFAHEEPEKKETGEEVKDPDPDTTEEKPAEEIKAEPEPETKEDPDPEEEPQTPEPSVKKPLSAEDVKGIIDERRKRQKTEDERDLYKAQLDAINTTREQATELPKRPDAIDDPDGAQAWDDARRANDILQSKLNMSELLAIQEFGEEKVKEAQVAFNLLPHHEQQRVQATQHPYRTLISERDNKGVLDEIAEAGGLDKLIEQKLAERDEKDTEISETIAAAKDKPPPSLAKGGHAQKGAAVATDEEEFEAVFPP